MTTPDEEGTRAARPAPSSSAPARRILAVGALVLGIAATIGVLVARRGDGDEYRAECEAVLRRLTPATAAAAYAAAAPALRAELGPERFAEVVARVDRTVGGFRRVVRIGEVARATTAAGPTARISLEAEFARATVGVDLGLLDRGDGRPALLGFAIRPPVGAIAHVDGGNDGAIERGAPASAPPDAVAAVEAVVAELAAGRADAIVAAAAPAFRAAVTPAALAELARAQTAALGRPVRIARVESSTRDRAHRRARVVAVLEGARAATTATFDVQRIGDRWRLLAIDVAMPTATSRAP